MLAEVTLTLHKDGNNKTFPEGILKLGNINAEQNTRHWLDCSRHKESLCCFRCKLFGSSVCCRLSSASKSALATAEGWPASANWRKLCNQVPEHENSNGHRECHLAWCELERRLSLQEVVEDLLEASIKVESEKWYNILK